jgi:hypothetical protein
MSNYYYKNTDLIRLTLQNGGSQLFPEYDFPDMNTTNYNMERVNTKLGYQVNGTDITSLKSITTDKQYYYSDTSLTVDSNYNKISVICIGGGGGGGGGGGCGWNRSGSTRYTGGGGADGDNGRFVASYSPSTDVNGFTVSEGQIINVSVGNGGAGGNFGVSSPIGGGSGTKGHDGTPGNQSYITVNNADGTEVWKLVAWGGGGGIGGEPGNFNAVGTTSTSNSDTNPANENSNSSILLYKTNAGPINSEIHPSGYTNDTSNGGGGGNGGSGVPSPAASGNYGINGVVKILFFKT